MFVKYAFDVVLIEYNLISEAESLIILVELSVETLFRLLECDGPLYLIILASVGVPALLFIVSNNTLLSSYNLILVELYIPTLDPDVL